MLTEIAIGDAYGAGFEFSSPEKVKKFNNLKCYVPHDLYGFIAKYTDDTQMSVAIAELLLSNTDWNEETCASAFLNCFKRDKRYGYSKGFFKLLSEVATGLDFLNKIHPESKRNGAAMRSVPLGFIRDKKTLIKTAELQARVTHNTEIAVNSSCAVALAAHFGLHHKGSLGDLRSFLKREGYADWNFDWRGEVSVCAYETVSAAFSCLLRCDNLQQLLLSCVHLCGDTDSVASIAMGIASCFNEYEKNIPKNLFQSLDEHLYGIDFLNDLENQLVYKYLS